MVATEKDGITGRISSFLAQPFKANGTVLDWFLFLGVVIVAAFLWSRIISEIAKGVD
jgi:hypothetical protein